MRVKLDTYSKVYLGRYIKLHICLIYLVLDILFVESNKCGFILFIKTTSFFIVTLKLVCYFIFPSYYAQ